MLRFVRSPLLGNVLALIALFVALGGAAVAAGVNPFVSRSGTIQACVSRSTVTKAGRRCARHATALPFSNGSMSYTKSQSDGRYLGASSTAANSSKLGGSPASAFLPVGGTAANSQKLGGSPPSAFLPLGGTAADSQKLGGALPSAYVGTDVRSMMGMYARFVAAGSTGSIDTFSAGGFSGTLKVNCADPATSSSVSFTTPVGGNVFLSEEGHPTTYTQLGSGGHDRNPRVGSRVLVRPDRGSRFDDRRRRRLGGPRTRRSEHLPAHDHPDRDRIAASAHAGRWRRTAQR